MATASPVLAAKARPVSTPLGTGRDAITLISRIVLRAGYAVSQDRSDTGGFGLRGDRPIRLDDGWTPGARVDLRFVANDAPIRNDLVHDPKAELRVGWSF